ncbi:MAG: insulinase family protein [Deltaproteobacteria bacterium]|nr:insulinase family protein [Deltaproteobacteria bacterium]
MMQSDDTASFRLSAEKASINSGFAVQLDQDYRYNSQLCAARFRLDNGLTIIFMPDRRAKLFAYQTWFRVGSRDENPTRTGLAHLFEHLMFKGTTTYPTGVFDREMEKLGTQTNAATWVDWTFYMQTLAARADNLQTIIDFEADRMVNLVVDEETFRSELEVVKNERRMVVDDSVGGTISEAVFKTVFQKHSYRWPTIGYMEHLDATSVDELRDFYRAFYAPNNATLVVAGDLDCEDFLTRVAKAYGPLKSQDVTRPSRLPEPEQTAPRNEVLHLEVSAPQVVMAFQAPAQSTDGFAACEILSEILVSGESSRLYRRLVIEEKIALDVSGYLAPFSDPGLFEIGVQGRPGSDPERIVEVVQEELERLGADGVLETECSKARNTLELSLLLGLKDADGCAEALGHFETNFGDFTLGFKAMGRWERVSNDAVVDVAREIFQVQKRSVVTAVPRESAA